MLTNPRTGLEEQAKGDPHANHSSAKTKRAKVFVDWLLETYGYEALNQVRFSCSSSFSAPSAGNPRFRWVVAGL